VKTDVSCFTCTGFRRNVLTATGTAVVILMCSWHVSLYIECWLMFSHTLSAL
jgi:hypothetical protein